MTEVRNLRCVVKLGDQIESVLEAEESIVLDHVNETFRAYTHEDFKFVQIIITHPHHMNRYKYVDDETTETVVIKEKINDTIKKEISKLRRSKRRIWI